MAINNSADWRDLFDLALFEPNRTKLRQCIEHARHAINDRLDFLTQDRNESGRTTSERIALTDALTTLADLHKIVYSRKPSASARRQEERASGGAGLP